MKATRQILALNYNSCTQGSKKISQRVLSLDPFCFLQNQVTERRVAAFVPVLIFVPIMHKVRTRTTRVRRVRL